MLNSNTSSTPLFTQVVFGHKLQRFNGITQTNFGEPIVCRHLAAHAFQTWMGGVRNEYSSLESIEAIKPLAIGIYDRNNFLQQQNMIICSLEKIGSALQYTQTLEPMATRQRFMILTSAHAMNLVEARSSLSQVTLYDPNETNAYYESNELNPSQLLGIGTHMRSDIPTLDSYLEGIESLCLLTERQDLNQPKSRLLRCWTQEPYEALGWCLRQSEMRGAKAVIKKFGDYDWSNISTAQTHFLSKAEPYLSQRDRDQLRVAVCRSNISDSHKSNIINNCLPIYGRSAA